jgi:hypothetical protein
MGAIESMTQPRHPERVFLREGSPFSGKILLQCLIQKILRAKRRALDDVRAYLGHTFNCTQV